MKQFILFIFLVIGLTYLSCEKKNIDQEYPFEAEVLGINLDCGIYEIKFLNNLDNVIKLSGESVIDSVYIAGNLPDDLKIQGLKIILNIGEPDYYKITACTMMGPTLNWVWITRAKTK